MKRNNFILDKIINNMKKLYRKTNNGYEEVYPLNFIQNIFDSESGNTLTNVLSSFNNIYLPFQNDVEETRNLVPNYMRRKGLWITYNNGVKYVTEYYNGTLEDIQEHWSDDINWEVVPDLELVQSEASKLPDGIITPDKLSPALQQLIKQNNIITNLPDDEDLQERNGVISFKDRKYNPYLASGKGYKILRKNWVKGRNILTQDMINQENTIYEIKYDFDLNESIIKVPANCILNFQGGSFINGKIFSDNKTTKVINPPKIENGLNDEIYWGVFYDQFNRELTYKFEPFNRPFEIIAQVATTRAEINNGNELRQARNIGINKYNIFIAYHWNNNNWEKGDSTIEGLIELHSKYNIVAYNIRFEANVRRTKDDLENTINLNDYINKVKNDINLIRENNIIVKNIFISNEQPKEYQNTKWTNAFIELSSYIKSLGYKSGISHWTSLNNINDPQSGAINDYNSTNFDIFGINHYPKFATNNISSMKVIIDDNRIIEVTNRFRTQLNGLIDRGYNKFTLTETGFSEYDRGMYAVDDKTLPLDTTFYIYGSAWKNWLNILKSYKSVIDCIDVWKSPTDNNNIKSMYNLLLNV